MSDGENLPQIEITTPVPVTALVRLKSPMTRSSKILASAHFDLSRLPIKTSSLVMGVTGVKWSSLNSNCLGACIDIRLDEVEKGVLNPECPSYKGNFQVFNEQTQSLEWLLVISNDSTQNPPIFADALNAIVPRRERGLLSMDPDKFKSA